MVTEEELMKPDSDYFDLRALIPTLIAKKWQLLAISLTTLFLSLSYAWCKPTQYQATVLLEVHHKQENSLGSLANYSQHRDADSLNEEPISLQIALICSKFILEPVIEELGLDLDILPYHSAAHSSDLHLSYLQVPAKFLKKRLVFFIDRPKHYQLLTAKGKILAEGNVGEAVKQNGFSIKVDQMLTLSGTQFLLVKKPISEIIAKLHSHLTISDLSSSSESGTKKAGILQLIFKGTNQDQAIEIINKIALMTQLKDKERKSQEAFKTLVFLYQQLPIVQASLKEAEFELNQYRSTSGKIDIKLQTGYLLTHLADINRQLEVAQLKKMDMSQQFTQAHPFIISLNEKIKELERQRQSILDQLKKLPAADQIAASLLRDVNVKNNLYTSLLNKIHEQRVITAGIVSDIGILSLATFADKPFMPKWPVLAVISLVVGLLLGCLGVIFWQLLIGNQVNTFAGSLKHRKDLQTILG